MSSTPGQIEGAKKAAELVKQGKITPEQAMHEMNKASKEASDARSHDDPLAGSSTEKQDLSKMAEHIDKDADHPAMRAEVAKPVTREAAKPTTRESAKPTGAEHGPKLGEYFETDLVAKKTGIADDLMNPEAKATQITVEQVSAAEDLGQKVPEDSKDSAVSAAKLDKTETRDTKDDVGRSADSVNEPKDAQKASASSIDDKGKTAKTSAGDDKGKTKAASSSGDKKQ